MAKQKYVYFFGDGKADGKAEMKNLLGGKGANIAEMTNLGIPVPAGFTITTEVCTYFYEKGLKYPQGLKKDVEAALKKVEKSMGAKFGDPKNPLLVSVRSGARVSMPGMMDTVLNIGLNDKTIVGLIEKTGNERFAYDAYRRFVNMYGDVVMGVRPANEKDHDPFEVILDAKKKKRGIKMDLELTAQDLKELVAEFKALIKKRLGVPFPEEPMDQLWGGISAVFESWNIPRAISYRQIHGIPEDWGTAVNVQAMVFGNMGDDSATGVAFTRDPATGENYFYGEYLTNAQGEDVVAGIRTPQPINRAKKVPKGMQTLEDEMPSLYKQLAGIRTTLEKHYREMQDIEFTIQQGKLWMLQTRTGKRTAAAAVKIAVDMIKERRITKTEAIMRVSPDQLDQLLHPTLDPKAVKEKIAKGLPASPGAAVGQVVFSAEEAEQWAGEGKKVILVRIETSPDDIRGMNVAEGILTTRGGMTSHAAVVARGMGKCCVAGVGEISVDYKKGNFSVGKTVVKEGAWISMDGTKGEVYLGQVPKVETKLTGDFGTFMKWADEIRVLKVRTNADTPHDAGVARAFGAEGIGLCRTEHMFFEGERISAVRQMILSEDLEGRKKALAKILPMQREDFVGIFRAMAGLPVTIRTLDPPLHEFLPAHNDNKEINELAKEMGVKPAQIKKKIASLAEFNPMLGTRGCRLGISYPEITEMQARAIFEAACQVAREGKRVMPEIMIPLVGHVNELKVQRAIVEEVAQEVMGKQGVKINYMVGTMIELPRAALTADQIAEEAQFFSFGTNDLTQTTFGMSRDDTGQLLADYVTEGILPKDPFVSIDEQGVGQLVAMGVTKGRSATPGLKCGICGEHGGDPDSIDFCHRIGLDYVSCSPYRVPIARLSAAQAAIINEAPKTAAPKKKAAPKKAAPKKAKTSKKK
ncbi:MAG: pyruvate, phosphate dikinase [Proteobacteria bacterium]|nr:pyruvate, phosphate dikinase [Pseudomonadota bacterium]MBU4383787.1 pyruvate, phosphate dikinase [Pseudomonadota bacterium]MCG2763429.1 pyruvate, phosphate dikinase [Desulfarculaceae bacterium]